MKNIIQSLKVITLGLILAVGLSYALAWTAPTANPPGGNVSAPINVSSNAQIKSGTLQVNGFRNIGTTVLDGNVGIGTTAPTRNLHIGNGTDEAWIKFTSRSNALAGLEFAGVGPNMWKLERWPGDDTMRFTKMGVGYPMVIKPTGEVGIGTTNPLNKLDVAGNIKASGTVCDGTGTCIGGASSSHGKQRFTSSGTFTVPTGVTTVWVSMSGGGGGGAAVNNGAGGGGGGAHAVIASVLSVTSGASITVTIGSGGSNGSSSNGGIAGSGGTSSFGTLISTAGGGGASGASGGASGGSGGSMGGRRTSQNADGGIGGGSIFGAAGTNTRNAGGYGAGGGGGDFDFISGGNGSPGFVLVEW